MDFLQQFLAQLGMAGTQQPDQGAEQLAMAIRNNGAPSTGIYDQNYASYLRSGAASGGPFSALDAQALFNNAENERRGLAESAELQRKQALAMGRYDVMKALGPAFINNIPNAERFGYSLNDGGEFLSQDPVVGIVGRATQQDTDETAILKDKAGVVETMTKAGVPPGMEWIKNLFPGVTQTSDQFDENGQPVFPDVGTPTPNRYSPSDIAANERQRMASDATVRAAQIRGAESSNAPTITVNTIPGGNGRTVQDYSVKGEDPVAIAAAMEAANAAFGRGNGQSGPSPQGVQLPPPQASQVIDKLRRMKMLQPGASTLNTQIHDAGNTYIVTDTISGQQIPFPKAGVQ